MYKRIQPYKQRFVFCLGGGDYVFSEDPPGQMADGRCICPVAIPWLGLLYLTKDQANLRPSTGHRGRSSRHPPGSVPKKGLIRLIRDFSEICIDYMFLLLLLRVKDLAILDCRFGFSMPNYIFYQLERSGTQKYCENPTSHKRFVFVLQIMFFLIQILGRNLFVRFDNAKADTT